MAKYLIEVKARVGTRYTTRERTVVTATDPGYAKYHWHRHMNNMGHTKENKQEYVSYDMGMRWEIESIRELDEKDEGDSALIDKFSEIPGFDELE